MPSSPDILSPRGICGQFERTPEAWIFGDRQFGTEREGLPAEFAVAYGPEEAQFAMFLRIPTGQGGAGNDGGEAITVVIQCGTEVEGDPFRRTGTFPGAVDRQQGDGRFVESLAAARRQERESVAETAGAMHVMRVASVDPKLDAIAIFDAAGTAPERLLFPGDGHAKQQARFMPAHADFGERLATLELRKAWQPIRFVEVVGVGDRR